MQLWDSARTRKVANHSSATVLRWRFDRCSSAAEFDGWLASGYRRTPEQIIAAHERYRAAGGGRAIVCAVPVRGKDDLAPTGEVLHRYAEAGPVEELAIVLAVAARHRLCRREPEPFGDDGCPQGQDRRPVDRNGSGRHVLPPLPGRVPPELLR